MPSHYTCTTYNQTLTKNGANYNTALVAQSCHQHLCSQVMLSYPIQGVLPVEWRMDFVSTTVIH